MGWLDRFFGRRDDGRAAEFRYVSTLPVRPDGSELRVGRWVVTDERVGIIAQFRAPNVAEVHLTNAAGETAEAVTRSTASLRVARFEDIPEPRRPARAEAERLGYV